MAGSKRLTLEELKSGKANAATRALNPHIYGPSAAAPTVKESLTVQKAVRQKKAPNKAEQLAMDFLRKNYAEFTWEFHALTLELGNGVKFTPDIVGKWNYLIHCYEVKAMRGKRVHIEDDSAVKIKSAPRVWPMIDFSLIWYSKTEGKHIIQHIQK